MPRPINEQVVVITGASSGIGRETALQLGARGASVVLAARNDEALDDVRQAVIRLGGQAHVVPTDVADPDQVNRLAHEALRVFGRVDTWINNAAVAIYATIEDTDIEEIEQVMQVNFMGMVHGVKAALPIMKQQGSGLIVNLGSVESQRAFPYHGVYSASKHAVKAFTDTLRMELKHEKTGIDVTLIMPAGINTPFFENARSKIGAQPQPPPPAYSPELVAKAIISAMRHPQRDIYVGGAGWMFAMLERLNPGLADQIMLTRGTMFKMQKSDQPDDRIDNLYAPLHSTARVHGEYGELVKPSMYTPVVEFTPTWAKLLSAATIIGVVGASIAGIRSRKA